MRTRTNGIRSGSGPAKLTAVAKRRQQQVGAAIDVGSNSVHLLVARLAPPQTLVRRGLTTIDDRSQLLGLGEVVDAEGAIPEAQRGQIMTAIAEYLVLAGTGGAEHVTLIGTEPFRRARDGPEVAHEVSVVTGLPMHVISERTEALLTFVGVTGGVPPTEPLVVVDIGGGSTEVSVYEPAKKLTVLPLPTGSGRLTRALVKHDPPSARELDRLHDAAREAAQELPQLKWPAGKAPRAVFVGGTATNLARLGVLTRAGLAEDRRTLGKLTSTQVVEHFGVRPQRAVQLAAGAAVVDALLDRLGLDAAVTAESSLRDGAIIAMARFGDAWPDRLTELFG
jgi:exopolyphosphatase/guanosine-5'-triphosphate,3'-diphosphate pyrophosphatase